jgi:hypothetical protein
VHSDKPDLGPSTSISPECIIASMVAANAAEPTARSFGIAFLATRSRQASAGMFGIPLRLAGDGRRRAVGILVQRFGATAERA